uniref:F-box domain-containing protein n=1 Tax=Steinernema glaseri TaxID=37863 RepID=A0A1I7XZK5_9BILA
MDSVPQIFVENVSLLLNPKSIHRSSWISSRWGRISSATIKKIHILQVYVGMNTEKFYAFVHPILLNRYSKVVHLDPVSLDSVDLKFITNFRIEPGWIVDDILATSSEICSTKLKRLCEFISPTTEGRPICFDIGYCNKLEIRDAASILKKLLSMRLPVDTVELRIEMEELLPAVEEFLQNAGPLYDINIQCGAFVLNQSTVDALIDKYVPVNHGNFALKGNTRLTRDQIKRLVLKCERADKKVKIEVCPEGATESSKVTDFFDFDKHYSHKEVRTDGVIASREGTELSVWVQYFPEGQLE